MTMGLGPRLMRASGRNRPASGLGAAGAVDADGTPTDERSAGRASGVRRRSRRGGVGNRGGDDGFILRRIPNNGLVGVADIASGGGRDSSLATTLAYTPFAEAIIRRSR
jgi:hypothetical protein